MSVDSVASMTKRQITNLFGMDDLEEKAINRCMKKAYQRSLLCLQGNKYFHGEIDPLHSVMYTIFLYWLSREVYSIEDDICVLANKIYYLNRTLNSVDLFYEVQLPKKWACEHPLGSVMGRATYGEHFFFMQGCTVGGNFNRNANTIEYPVIEDNVSMMSNSKIIGHAHIGSNVTLAANVYVKDAVIPAESIVFGVSPNLVIKRKLIS